VAPRPTGPAVADPKAAEGGPSGNGGAGGPNSALVGSSLCAGRQGLAAVLEAVEEKPAEPPSTRRTSTVVGGVVGARRPVGPDHCQVPMWQGSSGKDWSGGQWPSRLTLARWMRSGPPEPAGLSRASMPRPLDPCAVLPVCLPAGLVPPRPGRRDSRPPVVREENLPRAAWLTCSDCWPSPTRTRIRTAQPGDPLAVAVYGFTQRRSGRCVLQDWTRNGLAADCTQQIHSHPGVSSDPNASPIIQRYVQEARP